MDSENKSIEQVIEDSVTYRFVRTATYLTLKPNAIYADRHVSGEVFKLCRYRPNITKKGKVLWRLDATLAEDLLYHIAGSSSYYSSDRTECMTQIRYDSESDDVATLISEQKARRFGPYIRPIQEICFKKVLSPSDSDNFTILDPDGDNSFWIPTRNDFVELLPKGVRITACATGLHNKEFIESDLSQHEYFRIMRGLKAKGWQTKK